MTEFYQNFSSILKLPITHSAVPNISPQLFYSTGNQGHWESEEAPRVHPSKGPEGKAPRAKTLSASQAHLPEASEPAYSLGFTNRVVFPLAYLWEKPEC